MKNIFAKLNIINDLSRIILKYLTSSHINIFDTNLKLVIKKKL